MQLQVFPCPNKTTATATTATTFVFGEWHGGQFSPRKNVAVHPAAMIPLTTSAEANAVNHHDAIILGRTSYMEPPITLQKTLHGAISWLMSLYFALTAMWHVFQSKEWVGAFSSSWHFSKYVLRWFSGSVSASPPTDQWFIRIRHWNTWLWVMLQMFTTKKKILDQMISNDIKCLDKT